MRNRHRAQAIGKLELIQAELNALQADLRRDLAYAELRNSYGQLFASTGPDPLPETMPSTDPDDSARALADNETQCQPGRLSPDS